MDINSGNQTTLIMLSGGIDSVYTLYRFLTETDKPIWAHHINIINREGRHSLEKTSCDRIIDYLRQQTRPLKYTESTINHQSYDFFGLDQMIVALTAGILVKSHAQVTGEALKYWLVGTCEEETHVDTEERLKHVNNMASSACYPLPISPECECIEPVPTKAESIKALPKKLVEMAWTCRRPILTPDGPKVCGSCHTCKTMHQVYSTDS